MSFDRKIVTIGKKRVFDGFFKIDEVTLSHRQYNGEMSPDKSLLIFERGDAVAALLFDRHTAEVILVEQLKAPVIEKSRSGGWLVEVMAGMIRPGETADQAVVREAREETGYAIKDPELIATFFSSPGGSSERIFLYYAVVDDSMRADDGGGNRAEGEDIRTVRQPAQELFDRLARAEIEDPKLVIAAYHLRDRLKIEPPKPAVLQPGTIRYQRPSGNAPIIGIKTGPILSVKDVDVWVNSENTDMMMDRVIGRTISANIRYGGSEKNLDGHITEDTIADALRAKLGRRGFVRLGTIVETIPGALRGNGVKRILHVASVEGIGPGKGVRTDLVTLQECVAKALGYAEKRNRGFRMLSRRDTSILIPMIGAGDGGLTVEQVAPRIVEAIAEFIDATPDPTIREFFMLAYTTKDRAACEKAIANLGGYERAPTA